MIKLLDLPFGWLLVFHRMLMAFCMPDFGVVKLENEKFVRSLSLIDGLIIFHYNSAIQILFC